MKFLMSFLLPLLKNVAIFASFQVSRMFCYSVASYCAMVSSFAFNLICANLIFSCFFFIFLSAASTFHAIIGGTYSGSVCIVTAWSPSYNSD